MSIDNDTCTAFRVKWWGTPFADYSCAPGPDGGVDCVHLALDWLRTLGFISELPWLPPYNADWGCHNPRNLILDVLRSPGLIDCVEVLRWSTVRLPSPGDIIAFSTGQGVGHLGIWLPSAKVLHTLRGSVVREHRLGDLRHFAKRVTLTPVEIYRPRIPINR